MIEGLLAVSGQQAVLPDKLWAILNENLMDADPFYRPFYSNTGLCEEMPSIFAEVARLNEVRGHVIVCLGDMPLRDEDLEIAGILTELLRAKLERRSQQLDNRMATLNTALQLAISPGVSQHRAQQARQTLGESLKPGYQIMVTTFESVSSQRALADYAARELRRQYPNAVSLVHDGSVVTLVASLKSKGWAESGSDPLTTRFFGHMQRYQLAAGLSETFGDLACLQSHYRQALLCARMALRLDVPSPASYHEHMPLCLATALLENERPETLIHPAFSALARYDEEHASQYLETLHAHMHCLGNRQKAADELSIHKNTLAYRLDKIETLFNIDLDSPTGFASLYLSALIWSVSQRTG